MKGPFIYHWGRLIPNIHSGFAAQYNLVIAISLLFFFSCKTDSGQKEELKQINLPSSQVNTDSLKRLYQEKISRNTGLLPPKRLIEAGKLYPVDEGQLDTAFFLFREDLLAAIERKDVFFILDLIDENIKCDFGGRGGVADFVEMWQLDDPDKAEKSSLWPQLEQLLQLGGIFDKQNYIFIAPYVFSTFPDKYDTFSHGAITGQGVRLRDLPNLNGKILKNTSYDIVQFLSMEKEETIGGETHPWVKIKLLDATEGYVYGKYYRSPIDIRAGFEKKTNAWKMIFLLAGD